MEISYSKIEGYCNDLHKVAKHMKETLDNVESVSKKLTTSGAWDGLAADKFKSKLSSLTGTFDEIFDEIENTILYLANISDGYKAVDSKIMKEICNNLHITEPSTNTSKIYR